MESRKGNSERMECFANRIKEWNQKIDRVVVVCMIAFLVMLALYSLVINERELLNAQYVWMLMAMLILNMLGSMYVLWFFISYMVVNGKDGKLVQGFAASAEYMPFSLKEYITLVHRRLKQTFWGIGFSSFLIILLGSFVYGTYDSAAGKMRFVLVDIQSVSQILGLVAIAVLETSLILIMMNLCFCLMRYLLFRMEKSKKEKGGQQKEPDDTQVSGIPEKKKHVGIIGKVIVCVIVLGILAFLGNSVRSDEDPVFGLGIFFIGILKLCVDYWFFSVPVIGLVVVWLLPVNFRNLEKTRTILWWLLLAAIVLVGIPLLLSGCYDLYYGAYSVYEIKSELSIVGTLFLLFFVALCLGIDRYSGDRNTGEMLRGKENAEKMESFETRLNVKLITGMLAMTVVFVSAFFYKCFTPDGVEVRQFSNVKSYRWEDVKSYAFRAQLGGYLAVDLKMADGENVTYKVMGMSCTNDGYEDKMYLYDERYASETQNRLSDMDSIDYYDTTETYIMWMTSKLEECGVTCASDWEALERDLRGGYDSLLYKLQEIAG